MKNTITKKIIKATKKFISFNPELRDELWVNGTTETRMLIFDLVIRNKYLAEIFANNFSGDINSENTTSSEIESVASKFEIENIPNYELWRKYNKAFFTK